MRRIRTAAGITVATALLSGAAGLGVAAADETDDVPTRQEVEQAQGAAVAAASTVDEVRARLALANARLEAASMQAAQAAEAYNGARWRADEARRAAEKARTAAGTAAADQEGMRRDYADLMVASYQDTPQLAALQAITEADGLSSMLQTASTLRSGQAALDQRYDELRAATVVATTAADRAEDAQDTADAAADEALAARDAATAAADSANAEAAAVAAEKTRLIADLARLQDISVALAERRQAGLEERARQAAAAAAEREARRQARQAAAEAAAEAAAQQAAADAAEQAEQDEQDEQDADQGDDDTSSGQHKQAVPDEAPPAPGAGVPAVLAFARAQLGDPYRWGASGPSAWDCSGLTAGAWAAAGKSLPHYSVAQYEQSTPIRSSDLRPGDLVFWGSSSSPSSIYHVALYAGNGKIIHAPRTGKPVTEESMYYWIPPGFFARP
ncbi:MAG TPA: C40 family peptidase [Nocardioides sp.]|uniref:C40 family peptidase n=1 Tax=Nocardioides sp. TaxID=35761 RepID=UPI002CAA5511|nr:C40 family peptidase [Nocardioides sp.]HTW18059.1 C40 family peptidase [Nocardioides sp.]